MSVKFVFTAAICLLMSFTPTVFALDTKDSTSSEPSQEFIDYVAEHPMDVLTAILLGDDRFDQAKPKLPSEIRAESSSFLSDWRRVNVAQPFDTSSENTDSADANLRRNHMLRVAVALYDSSVLDDAKDMLKSFRAADIQSLPQSAVSSLASWLNANSHSRISDYARFLIAQCYRNMLLDIPDKSPQKKLLESKLAAYLSQVGSGRQKLLSEISKAESGKSDEE